ncbi:1-aminocyclopropane-1-carboxylate deaminase/D-cysteine desulfhydrase [Mucilaginibacter conchicola]|uniref:1-aminocyclopropane-1-carboxylate deaminase/D-cysteine desulfhydrase n=1 Tax=Mucilaginibacter conchicola TaxID=2303333 RepID=A0A372NYC5_9SPHI|nr:pyridoxal-phosphate dependent enzyme [Mucilaginibacter conchicola]RFZ95116.1 1-aminocyclopropane-1-carboxylate deaminase/D-cysteine desulfhydrase [Mucilaginibacter conchicola]
MDLSLDIYSPVQPLQNQLFADKGLQVYIKRDDLIHPIISGNKWRKLKYTLQEANRQGKHHLVTFGGAYSNHLMATAAAAAKFGFKATGFVRGEEVSNDTLFMCRLHGMQLIFTDRESYRDKHTLFEKHFGNDTNAFFIDEGGASIEGAQGVAELIDELPQTYDHIFCACGTGTTAAGIINGLTTHGSPTAFNGVPALKGGDFLREDIDKMLTTPADYVLHTGYHFGGYGKTTPDLIDFIKKFIAETGILIDPVYTGKMLYALYDLAAKDHFARGSKILVIHTGGVWGLLGMKEKFGF